MENEFIAADGLIPAQELEPAMLQLRATKMFTEGDGAPQVSGEPALVAEPTLRLLKLAKESVDRQLSVCTLTRWGGGGGCSVYRSARSNFGTSRSFSLCGAHGCPFATRGPLHADPSGARGGSVDAMLRQSRS